ATKGTGPGLVLATSAAMRAEVVAAPPNITLRESRRSAMACSCTAGGTSAQETSAAQRAMVLVRDMVTPVDDGGSVGGEDRDAGAVGGQRGGGDPPGCDVLGDVCAADQRGTGPSHRRCGLDAVAALTGEPE